MADQFLLAIVRQVEMKSIDWHSIATECGIPTANAARVRFTRLKAKLEKEASGSGAPASPSINQVKAPKRKSKATASIDKAEDDCLPTPKRNKVKQENDEEAAPSLKKKETGKRAASNKKLSMMVDSAESDNDLLDRGTCEPDSPSRQLYF